MCGCRPVVNTPQDELTARNWYVSNKSGIWASLEFSDDDAVLTIYEKSRKKSEISGRYACDEEMLYITSEEYCKTFAFGYKVYRNRAEITYGDDCVVFYSEKPDTHEYFTHTEETK